MELNQKNNDNSKDLININKKVINCRDVENLHYLYPYGHRTTHQMRWFKGSRDRVS